MSKELFSRPERTDGKAILGSDNVSSLNALEKNALNEILYLESERMDKLVLHEKFVPSEIEILKREREIRMDQPFAVNHQVKILIFRQLQLQVLSK